MREKAVAPVRRSGGLFFAKNAAAPTDTDPKNDQVMNFRFFGIWVLCSLYI